MASDEQLKALEKVLADPQTYQDKAKMNDLLIDHDRLKSETDKLFEAWERGLEELKSLGG
jgi:hypothetical protein